MRSQAVSLKKPWISVPKKDDNRDNMRQLLSATGQLKSVDKKLKNYEEDYY